MRLGIAVIINSADLSPYDAKGDIPPGTEWWLINGDNRPDIVADYAWLERTPSGKYIEHEIPDRPSSERRGLQVANALVYDVDNDGDNDGDLDLIAPGMGHSRAIPSEPDVLLFTNELR